MKKLFGVILALALALSMGASAIGEGFPAKEITYLCGYGAGGGSDLQARFMQPYAEKYLGAAMVVENLGGAGGCTALTDFNLRASDGYTISSFNTTPLLKNVLGQTDFDYFEAFDFLACVITTPIVVAVKADSPYENIDQLIAAAQENPEGLLFGSAGMGSITHLAAEVWQANSGLKFTHVAFKDGNDQMTGLLNGSVDFEVGSFAEVYSKSAEGLVRILASCTDADIKDAQDASMGIPVLEGCDVKVIQGVCVKKDVDEAIKQKLAEGLMGICADPGYIADVKASGQNVDYMDQADFTAYLKDSAQTFKNIVEQSGAFA